MDSLADGTTAEAEVVAILDATTDAMFRLGADGRVLRCNRSAWRILGRAEEELLGEDFRELLLPAGRCGFDSLIARAKPGARVEDPRRFGLPRDGLVVPVSLTLARTGTGCWVLVRDLTEQSNAQHMIERERAATRELRRLDRAKQEFLATVSHELRTPLTAILGFASLLRDTAGEHDRLLEPIERNAADMAQLVERLLDYSRLEAGAVTIEARRVDLGELIEVSCRALSTVLVGRAVEVVVPAGQQVWADPGAVERILVNLIGNAAKYSDPPARISVTVEPGGQGVIVTVADEGPGIDPEHQMRIFERFFRLPGATRARRGTGVGLAIVRQYVELHGGLVWVDSEPGRGSKFRFDLAIEGAE